jgi:hypothetical protein
LGEPKARWFASFGQKPGSPDLVTFRYIFEAATAVQEVRASFGIVHDLQNPNPTGHRQHYNRTSNSLRLKNVVDPDKTKEGNLICLGDVKKPEAEIELIMVLEKSSCLASPLMENSALVRRFRASPPMRGSANFFQDD